MIKKESYEKLLAAYLVIEFILFCIIKIAEQTAGRGLLSLFMYLPILLNFVVIVYSYHTFSKQTANPNKKSITIWGIPLALLFTLCADVFLVLIHQQNILVFGYFFFALVQTVYAFYLGITPLIGGIRIFAYIAFLVVLALFDKLLLANVVAGLTLFFGCDGSITLRMTLPDHQTVFYHVICLLVWTCYVPSQVALVTSYITGRRKGLLEG